MEIERYAELTKKLEVSDIDWNSGAQAGLSPDEVFTLTYFSDIEHQPVHYMRDLLNTRSEQADEDALAFLGIWNYEEYFHGTALAKLLKICGHDLGKNRIAQVRGKASPTEWLMAQGSTLISKMFDSAFVTLFMTWGATNEVSTHNGYLRLRELTDNPVLKELCIRIAKQERMHFSWYYNNAKKRLEANPFHQKFVRFMMTRFWSPVGAGVKTDDEVARLFTYLFSGQAGVDLAQEVDSKIEALPGLAGMKLTRKYLDGLTQKGLVAV